MVKFALVTLHVKDMDKAFEFYNGLLDMSLVSKQPVGSDKEIIFLGVEGTVNLELIPSDVEVDYSGFSIGFEVRDLAKTKAKLTSHGYEIKKEISPAPKTTLCFLGGPSGEEVELISYS